MGQTPPPNGDIKTIHPILDEDKLRPEIEDLIKSLAGYILRREGREGKDEWLHTKKNLNTELFPGGMDNHWIRKKFGTEVAYLNDLNNIKGLLESRIESEKKRAP